MYEIRRKLRSQRGVTMVFALVIFLIMALFSYVMVNASLTAVQGANASRVDEQAALSVASASRIIQNTIRDNLPGRIQYETNTLRWNIDISGSPVITGVNSLLTQIVDALNEKTPAPTLTLCIQSTTDPENPTEEEAKIIKSIGDVTITFTAEDNTSLISTDIPTHPRLILDFSFLKDGTVYYSNTVIKLGVSETGTIDSVTDMVSTLGKYQAS